MRLSVQALFLAAAASAQHLNQLVARQSTDLSFRPDRTTVSGSCAQNGFDFECGTLCILRARGDSCCDPSRNWGCPGGNFCLIDGLCCPNGIDPATCAIQNGVTLPAGYKPGQGVSSAAQSTAATPTLPSISVPISSPYTSVPTVPVKYTPTGSAYPPVYTNGSMPTYTHVQPAQYTGGAAGNRVGAVGAVVAVAAVLAAL